jgi:hypothetical protein
MALVRSSFIRQPGYPCTAAIVRARISFELAISSFAQSRRFGCCRHYRGRARDGRARRRRQGAARKLEMLRHSGIAPNFGVSCPGLPRQRTLSDLDSCSPTRFKRQAWWRIRQGSCAERRRAYWPCRVACANQPSVRARRRRPTASTASQSS